MDASVLRKCVAALEEPKETVDTFKALYDVAAELSAADAAVAEPAHTPSANALKRFREWLAAGGGLVHAALEFVPIPDAGMGVRATGDVALGEELFRVPLKRVMTEHTALADPGIERVAGQLAIFRQFPSALLALFLLLERQRKATSPWQPYIDVLPRSYSLPLFWTWPELLLLRGSPAFTQAHQLFKQSLRLYLVVQQLCSQNLKALGLSQVPSYPQWRWALSAVFTRRNSIPAPAAAGAQPTSTVLALIPGWDMCNHQTGNLTTFYDGGQGAVLCTAMAPAAAGQEVCIFYGPRSNLDLLISNGFLASDAERNPHDYFPLRLTLNAHDALFERKKEKLAQLKLAPTINYAAKREFSPSSQCLVFARVARWTDAAEGALENADPTGPISAENERAACQLLSMALTVQLKRYDDVTITADANPSFHALCALRLRRIEADIVASLLRLVDSYAAGLAAQ